MSASPTPLSRKDFHEELRRRGCQDTVQTLANVGSVWRTSDSMTFILPEPEENGDRYPDWLLDDLIERLNIPAAPADAA